VTPDELRREARHAAANLLTVLCGTLDILARRIPADSAEAPRVARARHAGERLSALLGAYLALPADETEADADAAHAVAALLPLMDAIGDGRVAWRLDAAPSLPRVRLPRPAFELALLGAARQAARAAERGAVLTVTLAAMPGGVALRGIGAERILPAVQP
jgi:hypothetical protein